MEGCAENQPIPWRSNALIVSQEGAFLKAQARLDAARATRLEAKSPGTQLRELEAKIKQGGGRLDSLLKNPDNKTVIEDLYLNTVSRLPTESEQQQIAAALAKDPREAVFPDLFWALLNGREFIFIQ